MSETHADARLLGAERAEAIPNFAGSARTALAVASPVTGQVVLWDRQGRLTDAPSLRLTGVKPRRTVFDSARDELWVFGDSGQLVRLSTLVTVTAADEILRLNDAVLNPTTYATEDEEPNPSVNLKRMVRTSTGRLYGWSQNGRYVWWSDDDGSTWSTNDYGAGWGGNVFPVVVTKDGAETMMLVDYGTTNVRWATCAAPPVVSSFTSPILLDTRPSVGFDGEPLLFGSDVAGQAQVARYVGGGTWDKQTITWTDGLIGGSGTFNMLKLPSGRYIASLWTYYEQTTLIRYSDDFTTWTDAIDAQALGVNKWCGRALVRHPTSGRIVGLVYGESATMNIRYSDDEGATWSAGSLSGVAADDYIDGAMVLFWDAVASKFVVTLTSGKIITSSDGATWVVAATMAEANGAVVARIELAPAVYTEPDFSELARSTVAKPDMARWVLQVQSTATEDRRISTSAAHLIREENSDRRIIDQRSHRLLALPVAAGTIGVIDTEVDGVELVSMLSGSLPTEAAAFADGMLYLADSGGLGAVVEVQHDGSLRALARFVLPQVQGPLDARIDAGKLYILCERRNRLLRFDLSDPLLPVLDADTTYDTGLYWERNPVQAINDQDNTAIRKFGFDPTLIDHGNLSVTDAGDGWALHGEIAAMTVEV